MKRTLLVAALLTASASVASAGFYGGLSVGPDPAVQDDNAGLESKGRAARLLGGYRLGRLSAEASVSGVTLRDQTGSDTDHRQYALVGKYNFPLGSNFELFGRAGIQRTSLTFLDGSYTYSGNGILLGPGVEYRLNFVAASASLRLDYTISYAHTERDTLETVDFTSGQWMIGFTVGI